MKIVVGLGNPGPQYENTRHNLGFRAVDLLAKRWGGNFGELKKNGMHLECKVLLAGVPTLLVKPMTFMNRSGDCLAKIVRNAEDERGELLVVYDELALPLGKMRFRINGSAGGHNGIKSIIERLGTQEFHRLRLGIADESGSKGANFVLSSFTPEERSIASEMLESAADAVETWIKAGPTDAMNRFN